MDIRIQPPHPTYNLPVCGELSDDGGHVCVAGTGPLLTMARIFKRGTRELWGMNSIQAADAAAHHTPSLLWVVDIHEQEHQLIGHIRTIALLYPDDHDVAQHLLQSFRTEAVMPA